jgi:hypothetical protein
MENENQGVNILALAAALYTASEQIKLLDGRLTQLAEKHNAEVKFLKDEIDLLRIDVMRLSSDAKQTGLN